jgi:hypothetical protein
VRRGRADHASGKDLNPAFAGDLRQRVQQVAVGLGQPVMHGID